ncbi:hypothetical protein HX005_03620 [Acinetobacter sp. R933-2]|nr:hypothetical protein [Acinetobacter sp. R933-2]
MMIEWELEKNEEQQPTNITPEVVESTDVSVQEIHESQNEELETSFNMINDVEEAKSEDHSFLATVPLLELDQNQLQQQETSETLQIDHENDSTLIETAISSDIFTLDQTQDEIAQQKNQQQSVVYADNSADLLEPLSQEHQKIDIEEQQTCDISEKIDLVITEHQIFTEPEDLIEQKNSIPVLPESQDIEEKYSNFSLNKAINLHDQSSEDKEQKQEHLEENDQKISSTSQSSQALVAHEKVEQDSLLATEPVDSKVEFQEEREGSSFKENSMYLNLKTQILYGKWKPVKEKKEHKFYINPLYVIGVIILLLGTNVAYLAYGKYKKYQQEQEVKLHLYKLEQEKKNAAQKNAALRK